MYVCKMNYRSLKTTVSDLRPRTKEMLQKHCDMLPRTKEMLQKHCDMLSLDATHASTTYGIHRKPAINSLKYFHTVDGLAPDIMQDLLEGAVKEEMKALLTVFTSKKRIFTLVQLNKRMESFK